MMILNIMIVVMVMVAFFVRLVESECAICHRVVPTAVIGVHHKDLANFKGNSCETKGQDHTRAILKKITTKFSWKSFALCCLIGCSFHQTANTATFGCCADQPETTIPHERVAHTTHYVFASHKEFWVALGE